MDPDALDVWYMTRALELAQRGRGFVEPNPLVGCVIVRDGEIVGEGYHRRFGGPHAEIEALAIAGSRAVGATMFITLEPCCHWGKTPPCTQAIRAARLARVVAALRDPFPAVDGGGFLELQAAGIDVSAGLLEPVARQLNAPYLKRLTTGRPWVIAKWAMTLDGKLATRTGSSRWISSPESRQVVHELRGRVDAILVGRGTAAMDDPLLTARPPGPRVAKRCVIDTQAALSLDSQLVRTARDAPVLVAVGLDAPSERAVALQRAGCEVWRAPRETLLPELLDELGRRDMTNVLVEGGAQLLGSLFDLHAVDELHAFIAPKLVGGAGAPSPVAGQGLADMSTALTLVDPETHLRGGDIWVHGRLAWS